MNISIKLIDSNASINKAILKALLPDVRKYMDKVVSTIKTQLPPLLNVAIVNSPEYTSLVGGKLKYEFGIPNAESKISSLINIWSSNINIEYSRPVVSASQIKSKFSANLIRADFSDVLYTDYAFMQDTLRGYDLPWLKWLLIDGDVTIIEDHEIIVGPSKYSRTGDAIMRQNKGKTWKVPSEFSGTIGDNWITRAIANAAPEIEGLLNRAIQL